MKTSKSLSVLLSVLTALVVLTGSIAGLRSRPLMTR